MAKDDGKLPDEQPGDKEKGEKKVDDWLKDNGYPSPDPKKQ